MKFKLISGYQNTQKNEEDFALTPYLFLVSASKVYGVGLCWGYASIYLAIGKVPKSYKRFNIH